jgi:hypothetical protein
VTKPRLRTLAVASAVIIAIGVAVAVAISRYHRVYDVSPGTALVSTDGRSITVVDFSDSCFHPATVVVSESPRAVSVIERTAPDTPPLACGARARWPDVLTARLREPLGTGRP